MKWHYSAIDKEWWLFKNEVFITALFEMFDTNETRVWRDKNHITSVVWEYLDKENKVHRSTDLSWLQKVAENEY